MATGTLLPLPRLIALDANANVLSGAKATFYLAGTSTVTSVYTDVTLTTPLASPVVADSAGRFPAIYLTPGTSVKMVLTDANNVSVYTQDNISAIPPSSVNLDVTGTAGQALTAGQAVYLSDGSGSKTAGQWFLSDSGNTYSSLTAEVGMLPAAIASGASGTIRLGGSVPGLSSLVIGTTYYVGAAGAITSTPPTNRRALGVADTTSSIILQPWPIQTPPVNPGVPGGRLTLTTGTPVTTADVTGANTIYYTPYTNNTIGLYDGTATWTLLTFSELSLALSGLVNAQAYDVFAYNNAGVVALETAEWANATITMTIAAPGVVTWTAHGMATGNSITFTTSGALPTGVTANTQYWITLVDANSFKISTTPANVAAGTFITTSGTQSGTHTGHQPQARQTNITFQNGVYVKSGATTRRLLGTFVTTATSTTEDSLLNRLVWNYHNRLRRSLLRRESTVSWPYTTATWRQANGSASNQVQVIIGVSEVEVDLTVTGLFGNTNVGVSCAIAIAQDSTASGTAAQQIGGVGVSNVASATATVPLMARARFYPTIGRHFFAGLEISTATPTTTWYGASSFIAGDQAWGIVGWVEG